MAERKVQMALSLVELYKSDMEWIEQNFQIMDDRRERICKLIQEKLDRLSAKCETCGESLLETESKVCYDCLELYYSQ